MIVICKRSTTKIVKNLRYEVEYLFNDGTNGRSEGIVWIKKYGKYSVNTFTDTDGNPLPNINITNNTPMVIDTVKFEDLKVGDILVCKSEGYKTLLKGGKYRIEELKPSLARHISHKVKFEGIPRSYDWNIWRFRKLDKSETREISLNSVLNNEPPNIIKNHKVRKIEFSENKNYELFKALSKSIVDRNRHELSIIDWACVMSSKSLNIRKEDYDELMNMPLKDILEIIETKSQ